MIGFECDPDKAARNLADHRVSFEQAVIACQDPFAVEWVDESEDYGEEPISLLGLYRREVAVCCLHGARRQYPNNLGSQG